MSDQFFDDEDDLAREQEQAAKQPAKLAAAQGSGKKPELDAAEMKAAAARHGCKPPSFGMAVGIAVVALLLGICIGYFFAMNVVSRTGSVAIDGTSTMGTTSTSTTSTSSTSDASDTATTSDSSDETSASLPEGHPDLSQFYNADGSLNEEAIAEWKAARAAETSSSDDADSTDSTDSTEDAADGTQASSNSSDDSSDASADASSDTDTKSETK